MSTQLDGQGAAKVRINGQEIGYAESWTVDITSTAIDVSDGLTRQYAPGMREVTITLGGVREFGPPAGPRGDTVTHLGAICCCRHCPEGGSHG